jgi:dihydroflavonol-4-reductase
MSKGKCIAVTGATGFLGSHLCERLISEGYEVSILARNEEKAKRYEGRVVKTVIGDIADRQVVAEFVDGADIVVHLVSNFRTASGPPESYSHINVDGTAAVLEAAEKAGVKRFVHCSTIGVHGSVKETPANEESPFNPGDLYQETKVQSEALVRAAIGKSAMEIVIIRPCSIYGPGDMRMLKMFKMLSKGSFPMVGPCRENFHAVYIDDLIDGFMLALTRAEAIGETFIIGGERYLSLNDYINVVADAVGASPPKLKFPYWFFYSAAVVCEAICVPLRIEPPLHRRRVRFYKNNRAFNIEKVVSKLGYSPKVGLKEGMERTAQWYRQNGYLD